MGLACCWVDKFNIRPEGRMALDWPMLNDWENLQEIFCNKRKGSFYFGKLRKKCLNLNGVCLSVCMLLTVCFNFWIGVQNILIVKWQKMVDIAEESGHFISLDTGLGGCGLSTDRVLLRAALWVPCQNPGRQVPCGGGSYRRWEL